MAVPKLDFDIVKDLEDAGASHELAKAVVRAISEKQTAQLATKADLIETREALRSEITELRNELRSEIAAIRAVMATKDELAETREALRSEIAELRNELRSEIAALRSEMSDLELRLTEKMSVMFTKVIIWLVGTAIASVSLMAAIGQLVK